MMLCAPRDSKMAAVQSTIPSMYKLPVLYNDSSPIDLPNCMYRTSSYHDEKVSNKGRENVWSYESIKGGLF